MTDKVLLTGISGWIAKHTAIELLNSGYEVLGTIRNKDLINQTEETIKKYAPIEKLSFEYSFLWSKSNLYGCRGSIAATMPVLSWRTGTYKLPP